MEIVASTQGRSALILGLLISAYLGMVAAGWVEEGLKNFEIKPRVVLYAEPAPYACPPLDFSNVDVVLINTAGPSRAPTSRGPQLHVQAVDELPEGLQSPAADSIWPSWFPQETPISWANKPFMVAVLGDN